MLKNSSFAIIKGKTCELPFCNKTIVINYEKEI